ncbi:MAG: DUF2029 domain-containing protein [Chloroflexi bacterium]|nr:DUF2029 domain-containing protein [Chloroflexota bacterium]
MNSSEKVLISSDKSASSLVGMMLSKLNTRLFTLVIIGLTALAVLFDVYALYHSISGNPYWRGNIDFSIYTRAANDILHGTNPYGFSLTSTNTFYGAPIYDQFAYPPFFAELLIPLVSLGEEAARYIWLGLSILFFVASFVILLRKFGFVVPWPLTALTIAVLGGTNLVRNDLYHGQVNFFLLFLITLGLWFYAEKRVIPAGLVWGITFAIKPFLGVLVFYLLWRRQWKAAIASLLMGGGLFVLSFVPTLFSNGLQAAQDWLSASGNYSTGLLGGRPDNFALNGLWIRLFSANPYTTPWVDSNLLVQLFRVALLVVIVAIFVLAIPFKWSGNSAYIDAKLGLIEPVFLLGLGMLYGPLAEGDHLFLLIPALIGTLTLTILQITGGWSKVNFWWKWAALGWAILFIMLLNPVRSTFGVPSADAWVPLKGVSILLTGQIGFVLFVALGLTALALRKEARPTPSNEA